MESNRFLHLRLARLEPVNPRRTRPRPRRSTPSDPRAHAKRLEAELERSISAAQQFEAGFDPRLLLKLEVDGLDPDQLQSIDGLQVVSQEDKQIVVLFATAGGLGEFKHRLDLLARGERPTRQDVLLAVRGVDSWTAEDRKGPALRLEGVPDTGEVTLDVELWPLDHHPNRASMLDAFGRWCGGAGFRIVDTVKQEAIIIYRLRGDVRGLERLLLHRDVRTVDLPPRIQLSVQDLSLDVGRIPEAPAPLPDAPGVVVLDSGLVSSHPLLAAAVGDAQSFIPEFGPGDDCGHGTAVAGLALYGDVAACVEQRRFVPTLRLFSGRITDREGENNTGFVQNHITNAVEYFVENYGCRVFNLSVADMRRPYTGGHVRGLAVLLDTLARTHRVLFVVATGNYLGAAPPGKGPPKWKTAYPRYLLERDEARLLDPAPALNVLTVGSLARYERPRSAQRHSDDPAYQPVARTRQPSPFSASGLGPLGAVKPDLVEYGGNYAVDLRDTSESPARNALLGEPSLAHDFATSGRLLSDQSGTSFAAPKVAWLAAQLLREYRNASANLLRALIVAHARCPEECRALNLGREDLWRLVGYGMPDPDASSYSTEHRVCLIAEERIEEDQHQFYEVPLPADFLRLGRCDRLVTVALAHTPLVRTTRADYRASRLGFRLVAASSLDQVVTVFRKTKKEDRESLIKELRPPSVGSTLRNKGTAQAACYSVKSLDAATATKKLFVVVTRDVPSWGRGLVAKEDYAIVVALEERAEQQVRYYTQVQRLIAQQRARLPGG
ncbi:MAG: S8 family peptidase [Polyangiaceae bacterium]|nr:S8 family peptidase [Polyangiaceae bacterium]